MRPGFRIVSLCGSAGALEAFIEFLKVIPRDSGMTFVVLTHRRDVGPSYLVEILSRATPMRVEVIKDGCMLRPNRVYVTPAAKDVTTDGISFSLAEPHITRGLPNTFDIWLSSVGDTAGRPAATVILSGMASDGSASLAKLKGCGGSNYAQYDAATPEMPQAAIDTGMIDYIGSAAEIAVAILVYA